MKKSKWRRYVAAVYLLLLAVAVILGLVALNYVTDESMQSLLLNLSTELAGAVLIFAVVDQIFRLSDSNNEEEQILNRLTAIQDGLSFRFNPLSIGKKNLDVVNISERLETASRVQLAGYIMRNTLRENRNAIVSAIEKGAKVQLLIIDSFSLGGELFKQHSDTPDLIENGFKEAMYHIRAIRAQISTNALGHLEVRKTSWIPSNRIYLIEDADQNKYAKIWLGEPPYNKKQYSESTALTLDSTVHPEHIRYFEQQFNLMWDNSNNITEVKNQTLLESENWTLDSEISIRKRSIMRMYLSVYQGDRLDGFSLTYLNSIIIPYLEAVQQIQYVIDEIENKPSSDMRIYAIQVGSVAVDVTGGIAEVINQIFDVIIPYRRKHRKAIAELTVREKRTAIEQKELEIAKAKMEIEQQKSLGAGNFIRTNAEARQAGAVAYQAEIEVQHSKERLREMKLQNDRKEIELLELAMEIVKKNESSIVTK